MITEPSGFAELTKTEQIQYLMDLWDRILDGPGELPTPEAHLDVAVARLATFREDPTRANPAYEVLLRLATRNP